MRKDDALRAGIDEPRDFVSGRVRAADQRRDAVSTGDGELRGGRDRVDRRVFGVEHNELDPGEREQFY
jgi:hypothetical protein